MTLIPSNSSKHFFIVAELAEALRALLKDAKNRDSAEFALGRYDDLFSRPPDIKRNNGKDTSGSTD